MLVKRTFAESIKKKSLYLKTILHLYSTLEFPGQD